MPIAIEFYSVSYAYVWYPKYFYRKTILLRAHTILFLSHFSDYCTSKFAVLGFAESLALEMFAMKKNGVKSTIVCPYLVNTGMFEGCETKWVVCIS